MKGRVRTFLLLALLSPAIAHAHGEEVLILAVSQVALVILSGGILFVRRLPSIARTAAFLGAVGGLLVSWWLMKDVPFRDNRSYISIVLFATPFASFFLSLLVSIKLCRSRSLP